MIDWGLIRDSLPDVLSGLGVTAEMWLAGSVLAMLLGFVIALLRRFGGAAVAGVLWAVVGVLRGTPFLVQLFLLYFGGPFIGLTLDPAPAGLLGLSVYGSAYFAELMRAGFSAVPNGHLEAAACVGLSRAQTVRRILLPEMALLILPGLVNIWVTLLKETAVLSIVTVPELTMQITAIGSAHFAFTEATFMLALTYWALTELTSRAGRFLEARMQRFRLGT